jgi:hypothetical protein
LIIVGFRNTAQRFERLGVGPILLQFALVVEAPLPHQRLGATGQATLKHLTIRQRDQGLVSLVLDMELRRSVIGEVHSHVDTEEA